MTKEELKELKIFLDKIEIPELKSFVGKALIEFGSVTKLKRANKVADIVWQKFEHAGYITNLGHQQFVDITLAACLLHNLFIKADNIPSLFKHRAELAKIEGECEIDERLVEFIYEMIEGQFGDKSPIQKLRPTPNSPGATFADAVWQINIFKATI